MTANRIGPKTRTQITYLVKARQKTYLDSTEVYVSNEPYQKNLEGYELIDSSSGSYSTHVTSKEDKEERTRRRAFTAFKDILLSNRFDLFVTLTIGTNRQDHDASRAKVMGWLKRRRKEDKEFQYALVIELHKRGDAIHFHILMKNYEGLILPATYKGTKRQVIKQGRKVFDFPNYTLGLSEVYYIGDTEQDRSRSAWYLLKYLRKEMPTFENKKRYWYSRGLKKPIIIENPDTWYLHQTPDKIIETDFGKFLYFNNSHIGDFLNHDQ